MLILSSFCTIFTHLITIFFIDTIPINIPNSTQEMPQISPENCPKYHPTLSKIFLFVLFLFGSISAFRRYFLSKDPVKNVMYYKKYLKVGVFGLMVATIAQRVGWWYLTKKFTIGFTLTMMSEAATMSIFYVLLLPGLCTCEVKYKQWKEYLAFVLVFAVMITYATMSFITTSVDVIVHVSFSVCVAIFIIDVHVLSCNQIRVTVPEKVEENEMVKRQTAQENHLFLGDSFMV